MKWKYGFIGGALFGLIFYFSILLEIFDWLNDLAMLVFLRPFCVLFGREVYGYCGNVFTYIGVIILPICFGVLGLLINYFVNIVRKKKGQKK